MVGVNDPSAGRTTRYEGAIVRDGNVLLIQHREHASGRTYWVFPGGGREPKESEQECVRREVEEETGLLVTVIRLLIDEPEIPGLGSYKNRKVFLCKPSDGEARPGYEPETEAQSVYEIVRVGWFDLQNEASWDPVALNDAATYAKLQSVRTALGYAR
jgi:8-oxo-dGTP pyrophosphatase MutT (NUDIX family)